jgi:site-specific DNA-methyltransferase (cytosine-N4-specific)
MKCVEIGFTSLIPILWKKISNRPNAFLGSGMLPTNAYISQDCEYIIILRKGSIRKFKPKEELRYKSTFTKEERDLWFQQIWNIKGIKGAGKTSAFPEEIPYRLIRMFSIIEDIIVDPFSGTGTTEKVAKENNRKFIGYQI